jgi:CubicO group peptidase (beta-lactamase class C family)
MRLFSLTFLLLPITYVSVSAQSPAAYIKTDVVPGSEWHLEKPESLGYSSRKLEVLRAWIETDETSSMMVLVHGHPIFAYGDVSHSSHVYSVRKSILAMLYGNYVANGTIDLSKTIKQLGITDKEPLLPAEETATLRELLASRSGIYHPSGSFGQADYMPKRGSRPAGSYYVYNNWDFNAAGVAFEKLTGHSIYQALQTDLASPIGMQDYNASNQKKEFMPESSLGEYAMSLSTRDMARLGLLMLDDGRWSGKQVIANSWIQETTSIVTHSSDIHPDSLRKAEDPARWGYGYLWWVWDDPAPPNAHDGDYDGYFQGAYSAMGTGGNFITVIPAFSLVIVHQVDRDKNPHASVSFPSYMAMLSMIITSFCGDDCQAPTQPVKSR